VSRRERLTLVPALVAGAAWFALSLTEPFQWEHWIVSIVLLAALVDGLRVARQRRRETERLARITSELERSYAERDAALEASRTGVALFENRSPRFCNRAFIELLDPTVGGGDWSSFLETVERAAGTGGDVVMTRGDCLLRVRVTTLADGCVLATVDDVTVNERERESRDRFVVEVLRARDGEMRKISELLHDDAVQELSALALRLEVEGMRTGMSELSAFAHDVNGITGSIRKLLVGLHPPVLESRGLAAAIDSAADPLRAAGVEVHVDELDHRFAPELELLAYNVAQEALSNVLKHARARRVDVSLAISPGLLECEISDDGCGFDPVVAETALSRGGMGLHISRERLGIARGGLDVYSAPGRGTTFRFSLPLSVVATESMVAA
jgi:signal transduction histidine kinase